MLGVNHQREQEEEEEQNSMMEPTMVKMMAMDEIRVEGMAGPAPLAPLAVEADLGRICSEELVKVTNTTTSGMPVIDQSGYGRPVQYEAPPRKPVQPSATTGNPNSVQSGAPCPYEGSCSAAKECRSNAGRCGLMPTKLAESYYGYVETVEDAVMIVEACRFGRLMRVKRRLLEKERQGIRSGSVFVFVERESGIRRWTDGKVWSPSRICGEFLIYRELESRQSNPNPASTNTTRKANPNASSQVNWTEQVAKILAAKSRINDEKAPLTEDEGEQQEESSLEPEKKRPTIQVSAAAVDSAVASIRMALAAATNNTESSANGSSPAPQSANGNSSTSGNGGKSMIFKRDGLIKKTISLTVSDETYHLICYFKDSNLGSELLHLTPSRMAAFKNLDLCRNPVSYPIMMLQPGHGMNSGTTNPIPPQHQQQQQQMGYAAAGRIMSNGQYIAIPQAYMTQLMPSHQYVQQQVMQQGMQMQQGRRLAPQQQQQHQQHQQHMTIATGSVQLPPVLIRPNMPNSSRAGIANLLTDSSAGCSTIDMENIEVMMSNSNNMPSGACSSGGCAGGCPSSGSCAKSTLTSVAAVKPAADDLEEEQLLFCHFLEAIRHEDSS